MRIVIDLQGAQGSNRQRGIGRYTLSLAKAIVKNRGKHEILLALNGLFPETILPIREAFNGLLPQENILVWYTHQPVNSLNLENDWHRKAAELTREAFLARLNPDFLLISSLFEGLDDNAVTSINMLHHVPTAVVLYDLIPLIHRHIYLENPVVEKWYLNKLDHLKRADLVLAISESSRQEGIEFLGFTPEITVNISTAADPHFQPQQINDQQESEIRRRFGLTRSFVMYTGGIDHRKNIEGLIRAYAKLPLELRAKHQLAVVCSIQQDSRKSLEILAKDVGLSPDELILTGFVSDSDLLSLYNLCKVFVFPSWHEGFGLPALEAMSCGRAVIGSNTSSIPEVIGRADALFDPRSVESIAMKLEQVLTDEAFRLELERHGLKQAKRFSWDITAQRAIAAIEKWHAKQDKKLTLSSLPPRRPKMAYISPLPPERSGISNYSAELLPELSRHYDIDVIVAQNSVSDPWIKANYPIHEVDWFRTYSNNYDRVLYHFGNSEYHQHMFDLLDEIPGVVVLHDFFLSGIIAHMEFNGIIPAEWTRELYHSHGYRAVMERYQAKDPAEVIWRYPCNLSVLEKALGVIVHSENSLRLAKQWYGVIDDGHWTVIPLLRNSVLKFDRDAARKALGLGADDFVVCSFGLLGPIKLNHRLIEAWLASSLAHDDHCKLIFVGENHGGEYGKELLAMIHKSGLAGRIRITGWVDTATYNQYLAAADLAVQLRSLSRGETSAAVLDCMNYGLPTIVNANGSMADLPADAVWMLPDEFDSRSLTEALETLWRDDERRTSLGQRAREVILTRHAPRACADQYYEAIEKMYQSASTDIHALTHALAGIEPAPSEHDAWMRLAESIAHSIPPRLVQRQLFVDISELVQRDSKTGIQRVVRSILREWLIHPPKGLRVEPVYATPEQGYRYARQFTLEYLDCPRNALSDEPIEFRAGDIFIGLDLQPQVIIDQQDFYQQLRRDGVQVYFVVYDLLPILLPHAFPDGAAQMYQKWLEVVSQSDGALCISKTVADELTEWIKKHGPERLRPFKISWFHLGADVENSSPTYGLPQDAETVLKTIHSRPSFLMVGTIEPRKGHAQTLSAFDLLWEQGIDINLVIVGKQGWMVEDLVERLRNHPELDKRLFWLDGISDEYLEKVYAASTCLIAASEGEGFGLPLIEAAQHKLPIIARDIPVFREVAGEHAFYFIGHSPEDLAQTIKNWLELFSVGKVPSSDGIHWLTWEESAEQLMEAIRA